MKIKVILAGSLVLMSQLSMAATWKIVNATNIDLQAISGSGYCNNIIQPIPAKQTALLTINDGSYCNLYIDNAANYVNVYTRSIHNTNGLFTNSTDEKTVHIQIDNTQRVLTLVNKN